MTHEYLSGRHTHPEPAPASAAGISPGKRTLTQSLPPRQSARHDERRAVADFDAGVGDDFYDQRATVDAAPTTTLLDDRRLRRARRRNPHWVQKLNVSAQVLSTAAVDTNAFALDVAEKQLARGLEVDGVAGPRTVAAIAVEAASMPARSKPHPDGGGEVREVADFDAGVGDDFYDERATVDAHPVPAPERFADDDPFGMHLLRQS